jgi:hypothetical protein
LGAATLLVAGVLPAGPAHAAELKVMGMGLGKGTVVTDRAGISCGSDCAETYEGGKVTLTATTDKGSRFKEWRGDCRGSAATCTIDMSRDSFVRAVFDLDPPITPLSEFIKLNHPGQPTDRFTRKIIDDFLQQNLRIDTPARFLSALPDEYRWNWILMSRSESLQTGTAEYPRLLLPSANAKYVFSISLAPPGSAHYPLSHPKAIEFMQWDADQKNFRFHEIVVNVPGRERGVTEDDPKCMLCHSTGSMPPGGKHKARGRPNWDTYDSWGGMLPFNRDRIYKGSVEEAAFHKIFNPWTWQGNHSVGSIIEQLELQPADKPVPATDKISREEGGTKDGQITFAFERTSSADEPVRTAYKFDGRRPSDTDKETEVDQNGKFVVLRHSSDMGSDEGRAVNLFDLLGGQGNEQPGSEVRLGKFNQKRIAAELIDHRLKPGNRDVRPIALAIANDCLKRKGDTVARNDDTPLDVDEHFFAFFNARNGKQTIDQLVEDTRARAVSLPRRKADIQKLNLSRNGDWYLVPPRTMKGLIEQYDTTIPPDISMERIRREVFRRPIDALGPDRTDVLGSDASGSYKGIYVDRETYSCLAKGEENCSSTYNTERVALYRYFLEPLGVAVDRWSMGVRGRSRTYTFADVFVDYEPVFRELVPPDLRTNPVAGLAEPEVCEDLLAGVRSTLSGLPDPKDVDIPDFTEVQRIFNKACVECHNGLRYPPYTENVANGAVDLSENEAPAPGETRLTRSYRAANPEVIYGRVIKEEVPGNTRCPKGLMPCGGPKLSGADIETIRRWYEGGNPRMVGSSHITTVSNAEHDFQGAGEFVLLRGMDLEIQARLLAIETDGPLEASPHAGFSTCASVINGVAVKAGGQRITYQSRIGVPGPDGLELWIDGKLTRFDGKQIALASGPRIVRSGVPGEIQIELPETSAVTITPTWSQDEQLWYFGIHLQRARATQGLMGAIAPGNWLPARPNGTALGPRPADPAERYRVLYADFANAWRVSEQASLFHREPGTPAQALAAEAWPLLAPKSCRPPQQAQIARARAVNKMLARGEGASHCSGISDEKLRLNCTRDVAVTGQPGFAKAYALGERLRRKAFDAAPVAVAPEHDEMDVATPVTFQWNGVASLYGHPVSYLHCLWDVEKRFGFKDCTTVSGHGGGPVSTTVASLQSGKSYLWKVIAEDGQGGSIASETWRLTVK